MLTTAVALWSSYPAVGLAHETKRRFTVKDSVEMSYFGTISTSVPTLLPDDGVVSPDGKYALKITHRGVVETGMTEGTLWMFDVASTLKSIRDERIARPTPNRVFTLGAAANGLNGNFLDTGNVLFHPQWADNRSVALLGRDGGENRRLFHVDVTTHEAQALTPPTQDVVAFSTAGGSIAFLAASDMNADRLWWSAGPGIPDIVTGTDTALMPLLYPNFVGYAFGEPVTLDVFRVVGNEPESVTNVDTGSPLRIASAYNSLVASLSPDAAKLVVAAYEDSDAHEHSEQAPANVAAGSPAKRVLRYEIVDLATGKLHALPELARFRYGSTGRYVATWSQDGQTIALTEVVLPAPSSGNSPQECIVAVIVPASSESECAQPRAKRSTEVVTAIEWLSGRSIRVQYKQSRDNVFREEVLTRSAGGWTARAGKNTQPVWLNVREELNRPPQLMAVDVRSGKEREIFDPNPWLEDVDLGTASIFEWNDRQGRLNRGVLLLPPGFESDRTYPLVVQTHGFDPNQFFKVGYSETSNAGRALAARDIVVLQVKEPSSMNPSWEDATKNGVDVYLAAIDELAKRRIVDPNKVGITGYSYTGWTVTASITRAPERFAAAVIANTDPVTLTGYFEYINTPLAGSVAKEFVGAPPYGEGLKLWIERVPSWSSDKIRAPVLFSAADPWHLIGIWDLYAALKDQRKPVELQYFRSGQHNIIKARHRYEHQRMIVDWFDFWLNAHETTSSPDKQYEHWRELRKLQN